MEFKTKSGKKVAFKDISIDDKDILLDSVQYDYKEDGSIGMPAYNMTQVIKQERLTNELEEGKLDETQTAYKSFVLDRINNFLANKGDTFESPFGWRDPAVCNEETCKYLWGIGFYTQSLEQEVR